MDMNKTRKNNRRLVVWVNDRQYEWFKKHCEENKQTINDLLRGLLKDYWNSCNKS